MAIEYLKWLSSANEVRRHEGNYKVCLEIETQPIAMNEHYIILSSHASSPSSTLLL
jgi:hypothetical protein